MGYTWEESCGNKSPYVVLPWAGFMWELHTVSINFNNLNNIGMCCTHHVQTYLEEKGRNVTAHSDRHLTPFCSSLCPQTTAHTWAPVRCQLCSALLTPRSVNQKGKECLQGLMLSGQKPPHCSDQDKMIINCQAVCYRPGNQSQQSARTC